MTYPPGQDGSAHDQTRYDLQPPVIPSAPPVSPVPYGPMQQGPYPPQQIIVATAPPTSAFAVTSLIFGIIGMLGGFCLFGIPCIVAVICGHAGLIDTKNGAKSGHGLAVAGLIMGYLFVAPAILVMVTGGVGAIGDMVSPGATQTP